MDTPRIAIPEDAIADFCQRHHIRKLALFGSVLRDDFSSDSDVDVLVEFDEGHTPGFDFLDMQSELSDILGYDVDLLTFKMIENSPNYIRRRSILNSIQVIYTALQPVI